MSYTQFLYKYTSAGKPSGRGTTVMEALTRKRPSALLSSTVEAGFWGGRSPSQKSAGIVNQWCNVVRWEKTTRPFLRTMEFLWQEGHTAHATAEEAEAETLRMLGVYADFCEQELAIPVVKGRKTDKEKFAGAKATYTIESLMHDGKALQSGTSHNFGDGFAKAFGIQYTGEDNELHYVHQTSWGMTTRLIGAIIMVHGDDAGLKLPPRIAPVQAVIIPIAQHKEGVIEKAEELTNLLSKKFRVKLDSSDKSPGWKFSEYEMKGVPVRIEIGPKDIENNQAVLVSRTTREKLFVSLDNIEEEIEKLLVKIQQEMLDAALKNREEKTSVALSYDEFKEIVENKGGFVKAMWCGDTECENKIKEDTSATSRCMPFEQEQLSDKCVCCGKPAKKMVYWGKAY
ncbi:MAG: proline--tRNA ligase [Oscillospiraceae bacterium]|nr:proline--tRNA ligase [Oscillospiraceae bacterium]